MFSCTLHANRRPNVQAGPFQEILPSKKLAKKYRELQPCDRTTTRLNTWSRGNAWQDFGDATCRLRVPHTSTRWLSVPLLFPAHHHPGHLRFLFRSFPRLEAFSAVRPSWPLQRQKVRWTPSSVALRARILGVCSALSFSAPSLLRRCQHDYLV
jgi:hypothetical protein